MKLVAGLLPPRPPLLSRRPRARADERFVSVLREVEARRRAAPAADEAPRGVVVLIVLATSYCLSSVVWSLVVGGGELASWTVGGAPSAPSVGVAPRVALASRAGATRQFLQDRPHPRRTELRSYFRRTSPT